LLGVVLFALWHFFSPWKIVIQIRPAREAVKVDEVVTPQAEDATPVKEEEPRKNDVIEKNFGELEQAYLKAAKSPSSPPKRSRDESIKLLYSVKSPNDWLDLIDGHDSHVSSHQTDTASA
jgi:hypothetical protein